MLIKIGDTKLWTSKTLAEIQNDTLASHADETLMDLADIHFKQASGSLNIHHAVEERSNCSFTVNDTSGAYHFKKGQPVVINYWGDYILFGGFVESSQEAKPGPNPPLEHTINCIDYHYLADKRTVARAWKNYTAGQIVRDLLSSILLQEGVTAGDIIDGPELVEVVFNYIPVSEALDKLAEEADCIWFISEECKLYFIPRNQYASPWSAYNTDMLQDSVTVERANPEFRTKQYILGGQEETSIQVERFHGDGLQKSFVVGYPIGQEPTITVNSVPVSIGIRGAEEGYDWYWNKNSNTVTQDNAGTALSSTDVLEISYIGLYSVVAVSTAYSAVADQQALEGIGTGLVEAVSNESNITSKEAALEIANARLDIYAMPGISVIYKTERPDLAAGQLQTVYLPEHDINGLDMLIASIDITETGNRVRYEVHAISGPVQDSWAKTFLRIANRNKTYIIKDNASESDVLVVLYEFSKTWLLANASNLFKDVYPDELTLPSTANWPCFDPEDKIKYLVFYRASGEFFRKAITKLIDDNPSSLKTTTYVLSNEANGIQITHIGWWGGYAASETAGTGIELDKQVFSKIKTDLEALQIEKTDTKGF